jgi:ribonuclease Z
MSTLRITGAWTKAGIASCIKVDGSTKDDIFLLDCGVFEPETLLAKTVLISHGHIDHVGACISHARGKTLSGKVATYFVPFCLYDSLLEAKIAFEKMDGKLIPMDIVVVEVGDTKLFGSNLKLVVFPTQHRVPSQGYAIYSLKRET